MADPGNPRIEDLPAPVRAALEACASGAVPANIAVMRLLIEARDPREAEEALVRAVEGSGDPARTHRLGSALDLLRANPQAWHTVKTVLADVRHDEPGASPEEALRRLAAAFDRAGRAAPEGSVALYALGNPELLKEATAEVVTCLEDWGLLGDARRVLDLGCGIGRFAEALAPRVGAVVGIDISGEMVGAARRRCAALANVTFMQTSGRDLSPLPDASFDLVLAADTFPYLVQSGAGLVERHMAEAGRVLRPGGDLVILNFSYRGDPERDRADVQRLAGVFGFGVAHGEPPDFALWDGLVFHLVKASGATPLAEHSPQGSVI